MQKKVIHAIRDKLSNEWTAIILKILIDIN